MSQSAGPTAPERVLAIDALRGAAIVSMFAANLAGPCLRAPHPMWLRAFGSFAAPTFVLLAGMMISLPGRASPLPRLLKRAALLLLLAAVIDVVCWGIDPFETFDVLYLLGLVLPIAGLALRVPLAVHGLVALSILLLTPWLHGTVGYGPLLPDHARHSASLWRRLLVDGWFPVFPWLGVGLLGAALGRLDPLPKPLGTWLAPAGVALAAIGATSFVLVPPELVTRAGYSELFYPPSLQYLSLSLGSALLALALLHRLTRRYSVGWLALLGRRSLALYVIHVALIALVLDELFDGRSLPEFLALYAGMTGSLLGCAWAMERGRRWLTARSMRRLRAA